MTSRAEAATARALRALLAAVPPGSECGHSDLRREFLAGLEYFVPEVLAAACADWPRFASLDGVLPGRCRCDGERQVSLHGLAILLGGPHDQRTTPLRARLRAAADVDAIEWCDLRLGERDRGGRLVTYPLGAATPDLHTVDWAFRGGRGAQNRR